MGTLFEAIQEEFDVMIGKTMNIFYFTFLASICLFWCVKFDAKKAEKKPAGKAEHRCDMSKLTDKGSDGQMSEIEQIEAFKEMIENERFQKMKALEQLEKMKAHE